MITANIYLTFNGNCEEAFTFYKSIFGGDFLMVGKLKDLPADFNIKPEDKEKIHHIVLPISDETCIQGSDYFEPFSHRKLTIGNNFSINININSPTGEEEITEIYDAFAKKGKVLKELAPEFWGGLYGVVEDQFGII